jgi:hypothetical protein
MISNSIKSELMLDDLIRNDRERRVQMEHLMGAMDSLHRQTAVAAHRQI